MKSHNTASKDISVKAKQIEEAVQHSRPDILMSHEWITPGKLSEKKDTQQN